MSQKFASDTNVGRKPSDINQFVSMLDNHDRNDLYPPGIDAQFALNVLCDALLGEDWRVEMPMGARQVNTVIVDNILYKYCRWYRKGTNKP